MTWLRLKAFVLALLAFSFMAPACTSATCGWISAIKALQQVNVSGGGGAGLDLSDAPFVTWDFNASLNNETPIWALTRSVVPSVADNASLTIGNATSYWLALHASSAFLGTLYSPLFATNLAPATNKTLSVGSATAYLLGIHSILGYFGSLNVYDSLTAKNASIGGNLSVAQESTVSGNTHSRAFLENDALVWDLAWTQIPYDTESFDVKSEFDTATYNFTARKAGYYDVVAQTHLESTWNWDLVIQVNGVTKTASFLLATVGDSPNPIVNLMTDHYYLNAGDNVNVWVYCNGMGGGQCIVYGSSPYSYFVVERAEA